MKLLWIEVLISVFCLIPFHGQEVFAKFPFEDPTLPWDKRVDDLISRLTLDELISVSIAEYGTAPVGVPRLDVKPYHYISECLHGYADRNATAFPQALGLAATFNRSVIHDMTTIISHEIRAYYNEDRKKGIFTRFGLTCFSPVINIMRHPLWGRSQESYGEDPYLTGELATQYVRGIQGNHERYVKVHAGCKHFDAYAGPENYPTSRLSFNAVVSERDLRMTFLPQFKACVKAGSYNIMCSYNSVNGVPACAHKRLMTDIVRKEWGFQGFVISDDDALEFMVSDHKYVTDYEHAAAVSVKAGCNVELADAANVFKKIPTAISKGYMTEQEFRESMRHVFYARMRLGEFDPPEMNPYSTIDMSVVLSPQHREAAIQAASMSFVLLKNLNNFLPLKNLYSKVAIIGPMSNNGEELYGSYSALPDPKFVFTPFNGLKSLGKNVTHADGCDNPLCAKYNAQDIKQAVTGADLVIVCLGTGMSIENESRDRRNLNLPGQQLQLLQDAVAYGSTAQILLLVFTGGPLDLSFAQQSAQVQGIFQCFFPSMSTGLALYRTLTGTGPHSVPAGRLPCTWPKSLDQVSPITDYNMTNHQTYRYFEGEPLFPFGYGLSYSKFTYDNMVVSPLSIKAGENVSVSVQVFNKGPHEADEVVQLYLSWVKSTVPVPRWTLVGFERVTLTVSQPLNVTFLVTGEQMAVWSDDKHGFVVQPGDMILYVGGQQPYQTVNVGSNVLQQRFSITV